MEEAKLGTMTKRKIGYGIVQPGDTLVDGIPVIKVNNIISGLRNVSDLDKTSIENDRKYHRTKLIGGELLISVVGTIGKTAIVPHAFAGCNLVRAVVMIDIPDTLLSLWVKYYIDSPKGQSYIKQNLNTTVQPTLNVKSLVEMPIPLFPKKTMETIVGVLKTIDDKIEANRRINDNFPLSLLLLTCFILWLLKLRNDNLEQQAQALFKSWFVDFEPFKDGEFVESEKGMIPKGWEVGTLGELCAFKRGKNLLTKDSILGEVPVVAGGLEPSCYHNVANTKSPVITVSGSGANAGFMRMYYQEVWASDCSFIDSTCENLFFVYCFLTINRRLLRHAQTGAVQPHVKPADIHNFELVIPSKDIINQFQRIVSDTFTMRGSIEKESRRLSQLRDALLPRLMSGELKVNEIEMP